MLFLVAVPVSYPDAVYFALVHAAVQLRKKNCLVRRLEALGSVGKI